MRVGRKVCSLKSSYDVIFTVDDLFAQEIQALQYTMEEVCEPRGGRCWKMNLIWTHSMKVSW